MSNCYDIEIKMNYFNQCDSYEDMLEKKKEFEEEMESHLNYFNQLAESKKEYYSELKWIYPDD
jgi:hypothetical protein